MITRNSTSTLAAATVETTRIGRYQIAAASIACEGPGGDWVRMLVREPDRAEVLLADAAGHGPAARRTLCEFTRLVDDNGGAGRLAEWNDRLVGRLADTRFVAVTRVTLEATDGSLTIVNAGNPLPLVAGEGRIEPVEACGMPLGILPSREAPEYSTHTVQLEEGFRVLLCSDGLMEARNERGEFFGQYELPALLAEAADLEPAELVAVILEQVVGYTDGRPADDISLVCIG